MDIRQALIAQAPSLELQRAAADLIADLDARLTRARGLLQDIGRVSNCPVGGEILDAVVGLALDRETFLECVEAYARLERTFGHPGATADDERKAEERLAAARDLVTVRKDRNVPTDPKWAGSCIAREVRATVEQAKRLGVVLTVEQRPLQPLAMGNYETVVSVREART